MEPDTVRGNRRPLEGSQPSRGSSELATAHWSRSVLPALQVRPPTVPDARLGPTRHEISRPHSCPFVCTCLPATTAGNPTTSARPRFDQSTLVGERDYLPCATDHDAIEHCRYFLRPCIATPRQAKGSEMILPGTETRELAASHVCCPVRADRLRDGSR